MSEDNKMRCKHLLHVMQDGVPHVIRELIVVTEPFQKVTEVQKCYTTNSCISEVKFIHRFEFICSRCICTVYTGPAFSFLVVSWWIERGNMLLLLLLWSCLWRMWSWAWSRCDCGRVRGGEGSGEQHQVSDWQSWHLFINRGLPLSRGVLDLRWEMQKRCKGEEMEELQTSRTSRAQSLWVHYFD